MPPALRTWRLPAGQGGVGVQERRVGYRPAGERGREGAQGVSEGECERAHPPPLPLSTRCNATRTRSPGPPRGHRTSDEVVQVESS